MVVTKVLQEQSGVQYQGVQDFSEADPRDSLLNVVITGEFKRGRFDKPVKVTANNIRAVLGYEPDNLKYMAIEDMLNTGAPFVWVMRVGKQIIACTPSRLVIPASTWVWDGNALCLRASLYVNDELITTQDIVWDAEMANGQHYASKGFTADQILLNAIFFYSGMDLYRQQGMLNMQSYSAGASGTSTTIGDGIWLDGGNYVPFADGNFYLEGFSSDMASGEISNANYSWEKKDIQLKFEYTQNLPSGYTDLVRDLWGDTPPTLFSCAQRTNLAM